jgi:hypothetical protein
MTFQLTTGCCSNFINRDLSMEKNAKFWGKCKEKMTKNTYNTDDRKMSVKNIHNTTHIISEEKDHER